MLGGNGKTLELIKVTLRMLRELHCKLPVEVWHLPGELTSADERELRELRAIPRDFGGEGVLVPMKEIKGREKNFQIKVAAWLNSGFEEIIGLDSDVMPVSDPSYLFETDVYKRTGQIFWPDWWKTHRSITNSRTWLMQIIRYGILWIRHVKMNGNKNPGKWCIINAKTGSTRQLTYSAYGSVH